MTHPVPRPDPALSAPCRDRIHLRNLRFRAHIGVYEHEQGRAQDLSVDIEVEVAPRLQIDDRIETVLNYDFFRQNVHRLAEQRHFNLLETLTEEIARACLSKPQVLQARVYVRKLEAFADADSVGCEIVRARR